MCKDICRWAVCFILVSCCSLTPLKADEYERQSLRKWSHIVGRLPNNFFVHRNMLFWGITQWVAVTPYRRFMTTYWSCLQESRVQTLQDLCNSYIPEGLAQVGTELQIWSTIYVHISESRWNQSSYTACPFILTRKNMMHVSKMPLFTYFFLLV
jgi:hypothetical protein